ncbi:DUF4174 domain-containing protein [Antarcticimicrobium sediminis]|uniref:DUF4174 domain-containing protein n=1 Tax=Antarcticimicrobium sediminis TaxID=2546227 RepID=A0A4R5F1Z4_9RHOB|nr:DUF4174 domain-containing protein [Antarcticimicrobium sediminis]TDE41210.1 DUF4174 domain-containing protein [Antarcticimicrobium sediminis]
MKRILAFVLSASIPLSAAAAEEAVPIDETLSVDETAQAAPTEDSQPAEEPFIRPVGETELSTFLWRNRPIVIFSDTPADPRFADQIAMLEAEAERLMVRDVVVLIDTDPAARSPAREKLHPRGFQFVLIAKDGTVALRKPAPLSVREITRTIDKMPMRLREIEERRAAPTR